MRFLVAVVIFVLGFGTSQAGPGRLDPQSGLDPPKSSTTTPDRLLMPQGARDKTRGKTVETIIPDICTGC
jgi:hypothetical protein